ncbi:hypothetical protein L210DRAFT_3681031 [Boletus edulis BED1]|uniref:Uncharacterized protein n=1 Tax=Boletus edulis BED1 TaxID=1328754 RepID=A0AAD4GD96_BOLED|nr:hypothetical protein L210DRAFT_3681031 [Boletus edulis BED1]
MDYSVCPELFGSRHNHVLAKLGDNPWRNGPCLPGVWGSPPTVPWENLVLCVCRDPVVLRPVTDSCSTIGITEKIPLSKNVPGLEPPQVPIVAKRGLNLEERFHIVTIANIEAAKRDTMHEVAGEENTIYQVGLDHFGWMFSRIHEGNLPYRGEGEASSVYEPHLSDRDSSHSTYHNTSLCARKRDNTTEHRLVRFDPKPVPVALDWYRRACMTVVTEKLQKEEDVVEATITAADAIKELPLDGIGGPGKYRSGLLSTSAEPIGDISHRREPEVRHIAVTAM